MKNTFMSYEFLRPIMACSKCSLCDIQKPLLDTPRTADVIWVGLSAVRVNDVLTARPLSSDTRSGKLVEEIESRLSDLSFYRTNLVKCLPESLGKIRYPTTSEMKSCSPHLANEVDNLSPRVVLLLGKQVAGHVLKRLDLDQPVFDKDFHYRASMIGNTAYIPVHHPSFVLVYRRRDIASYIDQICVAVRQNIAKQETKTKRAYLTIDRLREMPAEEIAV